MTKLLDRIYFKLKELFTPYAYQIAYEKGWYEGTKVMKAAIIAELKQNDLRDWSDEKLKLGYEVAIGRAEKVKR